MQIILNHFSQKCIFVKKSNKRKNANLIYSLTGVNNYDAHIEQRKKIFNQITKENYETMKNNISICNSKYSEISSTNFLKFVNYFESNDRSWIDNINKKL